MWNQMETTFSSNSLPPSLPPFIGYTVSPIKMRRANKIKMIKEDHLLFVFTINQSMNPGQ
jgi:hypothetical protein